MHLRLLRPRHLAEPLPPITKKSSFEVLTFTIFDDLFFVVIVGFVQWFQKYFGKQFRLGIWVIENLLR